MKFISLFWEILFFFVEQQLEALANFWAQLILGHQIIFFKNIEFWLWVQTFVFVRCRIRQSKNNDISRFWCHHSGSKNKNFIRILKKHLVVISYISFVFFIECQWIAFFLMVQNHKIDGKMWWQKLKQYIMHYCLDWLYIFPSTFYRSQIVDQLVHVFIESHIE